MRNTPRPFTLLVTLLAVVALGAVSCGDDDTTDAGSDESSELPVDDGSGAAGACLEGTEDCNDTPGDLGGPQLEPGDGDDGPTDPQDLPADPDDPDPMGMPVPDGALTPEDALALGPDAGPIVVAGFVLRTGDTTYLCGALAESFPPQCGSEALELADFDLAVLDVPVLTEQDTTWTDQVVALTGTVDDGVFTVSITITG